MEYYQFIFKSLTEDKKEIMIALLSDIGFSGFEEEGEELKAFISKTDLKEDQFENIISINNLDYSRSVIREINWNEKWESGFEPVTIFYPATDRPFVHLRAGFHQKDESAVYDIEVTPKMSFGTGHHATTYLMIEQMSQLDFNNKRVIDFGTGTGVLAILAEKLTAAFVIAIDNDDWSIENAGENILKNNCKKISLFKANTIPVGQQSDIILANINLNIIIATLHDIKNACKPGATILFSGIMTHDEPVILKSLEDHSIKVEECRFRDNWLIIRAKV